jgi:nicotinate-nucleotide adenylyltransferase
MRKRRLAIQRIGVYGGTFDPIHNGHVEVSRAVLENFDLDLLLVVPAACPPHKKKLSVSDSYHRYTMAVLATIDIDRVRVSTIEMEQPEKPYTYQTLARLKDRYRPASLFFVLGSDSFEELHAWREPLRILESANIIVAARPGYEMENNQLLRMLVEKEPSTKAGGPSKARSCVVEDLRCAGGYGKPNDIGDTASSEKAGVIFLTGYTWRDVSSTDVRDRARRGLSIRDMVPPSVAGYIEKYGIYQSVEDDGPNS